MPSRCAIAVVEARRASVFEGGRSVAFVNRARWDGVRGCRPAVGLVVKDLDDDAMIRASVRGWSRSARLGDQAEKAEATDEEEQGKSNAAAAFERAALATGLIGCVTFVHTAGCTQHVIVISLRDV